jgi:hypothetical protein
LTLREIADNVLTLSHAPSAKVGDPNAAQFAHYSCFFCPPRNARRRTGSSPRRWRAVAGFSGAE